MSAGQCFVAGLCDEGQTVRTGALLLFAQRLLAESALPLVLVLFALVAGHPGVVGSGEAFLAALDFALPAEVAVVCVLGDCRRSQFVPIYVL